ncbi:MAG: carboxypeptidase-like regulatory domain-containing protein [Bacteroidota bacterium]|nr:carboxypeptidase-like regulatory domain-containing protein [Bacteroidota bacterium]MDP4211220.1 carboxypeptidase-like regulatory domain-containing protein [Bacteroidota bacterium]MDP4251128.1 carboxypeptidase-like regulatory domain-containing protein [Bacteroidota bacterium]
MRNYINLLFLVVLSFLACNIYARDGKSGPCLIKGQVVDAVTKKPVSGVVVSAIVSGNVNQKEAITDNEGYYFFEQLPSNHVNLRFEKKGYQKFRYQDVVETTEKKTVKINVEVHPDASELLPDDSEYPLLRILGMK